MATGVVFGCFLAAAAILALPVRESDRGCVRWGEKVIPVGGKDNSNPCNPCFCLPGAHLSCLVIDCRAAPCVDGVHNSSICCQVCPNGENCWLGNRKIAANKNHLMPDGQTVCRCPKLHGIGAGFFVSEATCWKNATLADLVLSAEET